MGVSLGAIIVFVLVVILLVIGTLLGLFAIFGALFGNQQAARSAGWVSVGLGSFAAVTPLALAVFTRHLLVSVWFLILALPILLGAVALTVSRYCQAGERIKSGIEPDRGPGTREGFRFSLRTLFGSVWVIAVVLITVQRDFVAIILVGLPLATIGFVFIASDAWVRRRFSIQLASLGSVGICCLFIFYLWPRIICPITLPRTARKVYVSTEFLVPDNPYTYVRFQAPVGDCIATAEALRASAGSASNSPPSVVDRSKGQVPTHPRFRNRKWWFNTNSIDNGSCYNGVYYNGYRYAWIWIDSDRGIFYLYDDGF